MLAVAYCYLGSVYAKLTLHSLQFANNVGWRITAYEKNKARFIVTS